MSTPAAGSERRADADVDRRAGAVGAGDVDAVTRAHERLVGNDVGRREAELASAAVAGDDLASQLKRRAEEAHGHLDLAGGDQRADVARGDDLAVDLDQRHHSGLESPVGRSIAASPVARCPKRKFSPTETRVALSRPTSTWSMNSRGALVREPVVERDHDQLLHAQLRDQLGLGVEAREQPRRRLGP